MLVSEKKGRITSRRAAGMTRGDGHVRQEELVERVQRCVTSRAGKSVSRSRPGAAAIERRRHLGMDEGNAIVVRVETY